MSNYEKQIQATAMYYGSQMNEIEHNGGGKLSSVVPGSDQHAYDWADVLKDLEPFY